MWRGSETDVSTRWDNRGQSVTIGAIIVFGFLIAALGLYQITIVPNQNAEVEALHEDAIDEDFSDIFAGVMNSDETGESYTASVKLGTKYPARSLTLNPPPVSGAIRTTELGRIDGSIAGNQIESEYCGIGEASGEGDPTVKALVYTPGYNELDGVGVHAYENTATYQDVDGALASSQQQLVEGNNINLRLVTRGTLSSTGTSAKPITFKSGVKGGDTVTTSSWSLTIPTRLDASRWEEILEEPIDNGIVTGVSNDGDRVKIDFSSGTYKIRCTPLGVDETPENDPDSVPEDSGGVASINPTGPNTLELSDVSGVNGGPIIIDEKTKYNTKFTSRGGSKTVTDVRVPYVTNPGSGFDGEVEFGKDGDTVSVVVGQGFEPTGNWQWGSGDTETVRIGDKNLSPENSGMAIVFEFSDESTATYFISTSN